MKIIFLTIFFYLHYYVNWYDTSQKGTSMIREKGNRRKACHYFYFRVVFGTLACHYEKGCRTLTVTDIIETCLTSLFEDIINHRWYIVASHLVPTAIHTITNKKCEHLSARRLEFKSTGKFQAIPGEVKNY